MRGKEEIREESMLEKAERDGRKERKKERNTYIDNV
jgi:hypothetical protein